MKNQKTILLLTAGLLLGLAAAPTTTHAIFGFGKKKKEEKTRGSRQDTAPLPGMDAGGIDFKAPPKMAQEQTAETGTAEPSTTPSEAAIGDAPSTSGELPADIVIRKGRRLEATKPSLNIEVDPFESIRSSLEPDQALLLAESPLAVVWRRTHPEFIANERVIQPWLTTFSERPGLIFRPQEELQEVLQRKLEPKEVRKYQWSLTITDEDGKVFQHYEDSSNLPEELIWSGQNEQGEWMQAGSAYAPVYMFTDNSGNPYTRAGKPIRFKGIVHQERDGLHLSLDSAELFGMSKTTVELADPQGIGLVRAAADLVKRRFGGMSIRLECYSGTKAMAEAQCEAIEQMLLKELMILPQDVSIDSLRVPYTQQRVEIILQNR
ncbi:MAG: hypothetical protein ABIJ96_18070 [Elusimicrobiota bacterium]